MIITRTPFRMSFFGGGTDYYDFFKKYGGSVISTSFDKYAYVTVRKLPSFFEYKTEISYSITERVNSVDEISHPAIREAMKFMNLDKLRIVYEADLPAKSGLGTSSSFAVGLLNAFHSLKGEYASKRNLAKEAIHLERVLCNESGGIQDQIAVSIGGFNRIYFKSNGFEVEPIIMSTERKKKLNNNLMLFFTGFARISSIIANEQIKAIPNKIEILKEMLKITDEAHEILTSNSDLNEFGKLLHKTWLLKKQITTNITTPEIDLFYQKAIDSGALGGKLLGAGGGGFLLFYAEEKYQKDILIALNDLMHVPFNFEESGTQILYYSNE